MTFRAEWCFFKNASLHFCFRQKRFQRPIKGQFKYLWHVSLMLNHCRMQL